MSASAFRKQLSTRRRSLAALRAGGTMSWTVAPPRGPAITAIVEYPSRIQLKRVAGWRLRALSPDAVVVDRRTRYGNPFAAVDGDRSAAVEKFRAWITGPARVVTVQGRQWCNAGDRAPRASLLRGRDLACWCPIRAGGVYVPCHADVWLSISNDIPMATVIANNTAAQSRRAAAGLGN